MCSAQSQLQPSCYCHNLNPCVKQLSTRAIKIVSDEKVHKNSRIFRTNLLSNCLYSRFVLLNVMMNQPSIFQRIFRRGLRRKPGVANKSATLLIQELAHTIHKPILKQFWTIAADLKISKGINFLWMITSHLESQNR